MPSGEVMFFAEIAWVKGGGGKGVSNCFLILSFLRIFEDLFLNFHQFSTFLALNRKRHTKNYAASLAKKGVYHRKDHILLLWVPIFCYIGGDLFLTHRGGASPPLPMCGSHVVWRQKNV